MEPLAALLIRVLVATLALVEGTLKFLEPAEFGAGRFEGLGLPRPDLLGPFVGGTELLCAALVLAGLWARPACVPLVAIKLLAIVRAKWPLLASLGFWKMAYEARVDLASLLAATAILVAGAGAWSADTWLRNRRRG
jgi:uncharacterized membrane protein YphA (DoxX/SURF4 family)